MYDIFCFIYIVLMAVKQMFMLDRNLLHLISTLFWNMGFKMQTWEEKVKLCILIFLTIHIVPAAFIIQIIFILQAGVDSGLADHMWQAKNTHAAFAQSVDDLGDMFCPDMHTG